MIVNRESHIANGRKDASPIATALSEYQIDYQQYNMDHLKVNNRRLPVKSMRFCLSFKCYFSLPAVLKVIERQQSQEGSDDEP